MRRPVSGNLARDLLAVPDQGNTSQSLFQRQRGRCKGEAESKHEKRGICSATTKRVLNASGMTLGLKALSYRFSLPDSLKAAQF